MIAAVVSRPIWGNSTDCFEPVRRCSGSARDVSHHFDDVLGDAGGVGYKVNVKEPVAEHAGVDSGFLTVKLAHGIASFI
jgi:hypothetical protein